MAFASFALLISAKELSGALRNRLWANALAGFDCPQQSCGSSRRTGALDQRNSKCVSWTAKVCGENVLHLVAKGIATNGARTLLGALLALLLVATGGSKILRSDLRAFKDDTKLIQTVPCTGDFTYQQTH